MTYCYLNGEILPYKDCCLHVSDLQIQRGYGVFDFFRSRNGDIPWLEDYTNRLYNSLQLSGIDAGLSPPDFLSAVQSLQKKNGLPNGAFKVIVSGGYSNTLDSVTGSANVIILHIPWEPPDPKLLERGVNLVSHPYIRPNSEIKTLYYFNTLRLHRKLVDYNAVDVLYYSDTVSEASRANIFMVKDNIIYTPESHILKGITRKHVLLLFPEIRIEDIPSDNLPDYNEAFITSTSRDITPVVNIDGRNIGNGKPGPVTREIMSAFRQAWG
jgi:branched-subunit amino acid aminotransferase/4-amino-4-deoxychorismate lyase